MQQPKLVNNKRCENCLHHGPPRLQRGGSVCDRDREVIASDTPKLPACDFFFDKRPREFNAEAFSDYIPRRLSQFNNFFPHRCANCGMDLYSREVLWLAKKLMKHIEGDPLVILYCHGYHHDTKKCCPVMNCDFEEPFLED